MAVVLYELKKRIALVQRAIDQHTVNWNLPMDCADFSIFKGVDNRVEFVVRNTDRKPINLVGKKLALTLSNRRTGEVLTQRVLTHEDDTKSIVSLFLSNDVTADWPLGSMTYAVTVEEPSGFQTLLFADQAERTTGYCEVKIGPVLGPRETIVANTSTFTSVQEGDPSGTVWYSSALPGSQQSGNAYGLHSLAVYLDNFIGSLWIEGTLESSASQDSDDWFPINIEESAEITFNEDSGVRAYFFEANLQWVRVKYSAAEDNEGEITKIAFRN